MSLKGPFQPNLIYSLTRAVAQHSTGGKERCQAGCPLTYHPHQGLLNRINPFKPAQIPLLWPAPPQLLPCHPLFHLQLNKSIPSFAPCPFMPQLQAHSPRSVWPDVGQGSAWSCEWFLLPLHKSVVD